MGTQGIILIFSVVSAFIAGCLFWHKFSPYIKAFSNREIMLITRNVEYLKESDKTLYMRVSSEWDTMLTNGQTHWENASTGLQTIIKGVKGI